MTAWIGILRSGGFLLPSHPQACRARPRSPRRARRPALLKTEASLLPSQYVSSKREGEGPLFLQARIVPGLYMERPAGQRVSCGTVGPPASGQPVTTIADHGPLLRQGGRDAAGARWWASGASRSRDAATPTGRGRAPCRGLGPRSGEQSLRCGIFQAVTRPWEPD